MNLQRAKTIVLEHYHAIDSANSSNIQQILQYNTTSNWKWRGYHPFNEQTGYRDIAAVFWRPWMEAISYPQRRQDIFFAGYNEIDAFTSTWVVSLGHLVGLFDQPFIGIPPNGKMVFLRYCEFNRVENEKITETAFYCDLPHLMVQTGLEPFTKQRGAELVQPGPITHDGLLFTPSNPEEGAKTLATINAMCKNLGTWQSGLPLEEELAQNWHDDMIWWGPTGIGSTYTIERYAKQHSRPFRAAFSERSSLNHIARLAEGHYGGFFGWPNFTAVNSGGFLGLPTSTLRSEFRVIDIYRRRGDKLAENWVFIDLLHWMKQHGIDMLKEQR